MDLLLDTCTILWMIGGSNSIPKDIVKTIDSEDNKVFYSFTSLWEIEIKHQKNKELMPFRAFEIAEKMHYAGAEVLQFDLADICALEEIVSQNIHKDPFDHMLLAMAKIDGMTLVTHDKNLEKYQGVKVLSY